MVIFRKTPLLDTKLPRYSYGKLIPVLSAKQLLSSPGHQALLEEVRNRVEQPDDEYQLLYHDFICRFAEFVQLIPVKPNARLGTLLNEGLLRGVNALDYFRKNERDADDVECYALFTAAVLYDVANTLIHQRVFITEKDGSYEQSWKFSLGSLRKQSARWYKLFPYKANYSRLRNSVCVLLAQQILPADGYEWITRHWSVFVDWLDALSEGGAKGRILSHILDIIRHENEEQLLLTHLPETTVQPIEAEETFMADKFFEWLDVELEEENLKVTGVDLDLYAFEDGYLVDGTVVDRFSKQFNFPHSVVWKQIENCLGISKKSGHDFRFDQFFGSGSTTKGFLGEQKAQAKSGLYISKDFIHVKGAAVTQGRLRAQVQSRDFGESRRQATQSITPKNTRER